MEIAAPLVMGALGKVQKQKGLNADSLTGLLNGERQRIERKAPEPTSILSKMLDQDGDGDATNDVLRMGMGLLGNLFKKK